MNMFEIEKLVKELTNLSPDERKLYIQSLRLSVEDLESLIMPGHKSNWLVASEVIRVAGKPYMNMLLPKLLVWLQDVNWPGATVVIEMLCVMDKATLISEIEKTLKIALNDEDFMWIGGIKMLVEAAKMTKDDFTSELIYKILKKSDF